jgi:hypothetical protein
MRIGLGPRSSDASDPNAWEGFDTMSTVEEIEHAIRELPPEKPTELRAWFLSFDAEA